MGNMRRLAEGMQRLVERSGVSASVQVGESYLTYTQSGDRLVYTIWAWVSPYFGNVPAKDAIYIKMEGRTPDGLEDLLDRQRTLYGGKSALMHFEGKEEEYPYTKGRHYTGPTIEDIKDLKGTTVRLRDGKPAPIAEESGRTRNGLVEAAGGSQRTWVNYEGESVIRTGPALVESSVLTKGSTNEIRKSIVNEIMKIIEMSGVYVVANISTGGRAQQVSGSVVRMINFIQDHSPPAEHVSIVDFSTDRNWARSKADEI